MKALTICQPYATLIVQPQGILPPGETAKPIENRSWHTKYLGPLVIHAGLSRRWLSPECDDPGSGKAVEERWREQGLPLVYGAAIGVAWVEAVVTIETIRAASGPGGKYRGHVHAEGEYCFLLAAARPFVEPVKCGGSQGFWELDEELLAQAQVQRFLRDGYTLDTNSPPGSVAEWEEWCLRTLRLPTRPIGQRKQGAV